MSSTYLFGQNNIFARIDRFTSLGMDVKLDKMLGFTRNTEPTYQRIGELSQQTAKEGEPRPIVWGRVRPISGNMMHVSEPKSVWVEVPGAGGGKGGSAPAQYQELIYRTYAIRICEGPITGIIRVWRNNKLVYDARGNAWGTKNNKVFTKKAKFYLGGWDQMPDSTLESIWGAGEVPAYRGTCYMVMNNENLTEMAGSVPNYIFEVERAEGTYLTSKPYAMECIESAQAGPYDVRKYVDQEYVGPDEVQAAPYSVVSAELREPLITYNCDPEEIEACQYYATSATLHQQLIHYKDGLPESVDAGQYVASSAILRLGLIKYENYPAESIDAGQYTATGASLT